MAKQITERQKVLLEEALEWCDEKDKSVEFTIQYLQDFAGVNHDQAIAFLTGE